MIPNTQHRELSVSGVMASGAFEISKKDEAHVMGILRDTLYTDKILAVLREYSSNAWDAHRDAGKGDLPIKITLPTTEEPSLRIRDYGLGLSPSDVFKVYTQYGASTKRNSDSVVGMLGIGSKSGFAYSDSFTVTSYHAGVKTTYVAVLDASDKGIMSVLHEEPTDETGVEVQIAADTKDIYQFKQHADYLFRYLTPAPVINTTLPAPPEAKHVFKHGIITENPDYSDGGHWTALMGCVPYRINVNQVHGKVDPNVYNLSGILYLDIGDAQVTASREELKYSDSTKESLVCKFNALMDEYVQTLLTRITEPGLTDWERRLRAREFRHIKSNVLDGVKEWLREGETLKDVTKTYKIKTIERNTHATHIPVSPHTRLILRDVRQALAGYGFSKNDLIVHKEGGKITWEDVRTELGAFIVAHNLGGIPIVSTSTLPWTRPLRSTSGRATNIKHRMPVFRLEYWHHSGPASNNWEPVADRVPSDSDVFVILEKFKTPGYDLFGLYSQDQQIAKYLGKDMPEVYGYRSTRTDPITVSDCKGTYYQTWRKENLRKMFTKKFEDEVDDWCWRREFTRLSHHELAKVVTVAKKMLGAQHAFTAYFQRGWDTQKNKAMDDVPYVVRNLVNNALEEISLPDNAVLAREELYKTYPLLGLISMYTVCQSDKLEALCHYIKMADKP